MQIGANKPLFIAITIEMSFQQRFKIEYSGFKEDFLEDALIKFENVFKGKKIRRSVQRSILT